jgi:dTDP-4-amino-4,6-dideoxygalactose transaminase
MWSKGIQVNINNRRNDLYEMFGGLQKDLINLEKADKDVILVPLHNDLSEFDIERIINSIKEYDKH